MTLEKLMYEYEITSRIDFIKFAELEMDNQKVIKSYQHGINKCQPYEK
jgi:hypothetical protein